MFELMSCLCLWASCRMWVTVNGWLLQWLQVGGVVSFNFMSVSQLGMTKHSQACDTYSFFPVANVCFVFVGKSLGCFCVVECF